MLASLGTEESAPLVRQITPARGRPIGGAGAGDEQHALHHLGVLAETLRARGRWASEALYSPSAERCAGEHPRLPTYSCSIFRLDDPNEVYIYGLCTVIYQEPSTASSGRAAVFNDTSQSQRKRE